MRIRTQRLPTGYRELEYIESTGTQYIDTGFATKNGMTYEAHFYMTDSIAYNTSIMGDASWAGCFYIRPSGYYEVSGKTGYGRFDLSITQSRDIVIKYKEPYTQSTINDVTVITQYASSYSYNGNLFIFKGGTYSNVHARLYSCKIYDNSTLARNFIPAERCSDNKPGLYDVVNNVFYINKGTGEFIKGPYKDSYQVSLYPRLPLEYQEVEYIESSGTQYMNIGPSLGNNWEIILDQMNNFNNDNHYMCGSSTAAKMLGTLNDRLWSNGILYSSVTFNRNTREKIGFKVITDSSKGSDFVMTNYTTGNTQSGHSSYIPTSSNIVSLFTVYGTGRFESFRCYNAQIYKDNQLVRNMIPCYRKSNNVIGMYDLVGKQFYTNVGTGKFSKGNNVNNTLSCKPHIVIEEGTTNYGRMKENVSLISGLSSDWSLEKLDRDTIKVTALKDNPSYSDWGNIVGTMTTPGVTIPAGEPVTLSCEVVDYKGSLSRIYPSSGGFGTIVGYGTYAGRVYRTITYNQNWGHDICIRTANQANIKAGDYLVIRNTQIEKKDHPTLYTPDTRPDNYII